MFLEFGLVHFEYCCMQITCFSNNFNGKLRRPLHGFATTYSGAVLAHYTSIFHLRSFQIAHFHVYNIALTEVTTPQLFEKGFWRNIKSHFGAFNTQWKLVSNWNPSLKYLSTLHFLTKMAEIFCGVKGDAKAAGNNFLRILDTLEMLENG